MLLPSRAEKFYNGTRIQGLKSLTLPLPQNPRGKETAIKKPGYLTSITGLMFLFVLAHTGHHIVSSLLTPLLPFIRNDFNLTYTQAGWLVSAFNLAYGIGNLPAGWLADRIGPRLVLTIGVAGVALAGLFVGLSPNLILLTVFLVLMGIAGGGYHPSAAPLVSTSAKPQNRGRALGFHQIGGSVSFFVAPLIAAGIASALGWRGTFIAVAVPTLAFGIVFYLLLGRLQGISPANNTSDIKPTTASSQNKKLPNQCHLRRLITVLAMGIASMVLIYSTTSFIPLFIVDNYGISEEAAAATIALYFSGGLWAGPLGGYLSDRWGKVPVILVVGLIGSPAVFLLNIAPFGVALSAVLIILGMAQHLSMPVVESYIISYCPKNRRSTVLGIYYFGSRGGPGVMAPAIGYLMDLYGFYAAFLAVAVALAAITVICIALLWGSRD